MNTSLKVALIFLTIPSIAIAGVAEKKARRAAGELAAAEIETLKSNCGNAEFSVNYDWNEFDALFAAEKAKIEERGDRNEWIIEKVSDRTALVIKALYKICEADADYKEEIAKLTSIDVGLKTSYEDYKSEFALDGTTIRVKTGHVMNRSWSDFEDKLKELF